MGLNLLPARYRSPPPAKVDEERGLPLQWFVDMFQYGGVTYPSTSMTQTLRGNVEGVTGDYGGLAAGAYRANAVVAAALFVRMRHFTEARFQFQELRNGRPGNLYGDASLTILETPWENGTTADLLARMVNDADLGGNAFILRQPDRLFRLRPDWVEIMLGSRERRRGWVNGADDTTVAGYLYTPGGKHSGNDPSLYLPEQVAHWAPIPDPRVAYRGMSVLNPLTREIQADQAMTDHKLKFLEQGATVNMVVKVNATTRDLFDRAVGEFKEGHQGIANAYKTLFLTAGSDVQAIGSDLQQMAFTDVQGAGELRIGSSVLSVPAVLLGLREGQKGSTLNSGNYQESRRMFADGWCRPSWRGAAAALQTIVPPPNPASRLWYDDRDIAFLKEDVKDAAEVMKLNAEAASSLYMAGWDPDAIIDTIASGDLRRLLKQHSGAPSVQVQSTTGSANGKPPPVAVQSP